MKKLRVAIIGQGRSGRDIHGAYFLSAANSNFEVVAVVDAIEDRRNRAAKDFGCPVFADYTELFGMKDQIDLVVNSTFSYMHAPITIDLADHGFNVVCEKPFARRDRDDAPRRRREERRDDWRKEKERRQPKRDERPAARRPREDEGRRPSAPRRRREG